MYISPDGFVSPTELVKILYGGVEKQPKGEEATRWLDYALSRILFDTRADIVRASVVPLSPTLS